MGNENKNATEAAKRVIEKRQRLLQRLAHDNYTSRLIHLSELLFECTECKCLVQADNMPEHTAWHEKML
jgi:hypothetical protein